MSYDQKAFDDARWERDIASIRITGMIWALMQLGALDDMRERLPHTYVDLGKFLAEYDHATYRIDELLNNRQPQDERSEA